MTSHYSKLRLLAIVAATLSTTAVNAAPSIYPTGVTRYDPAKAYNSYVLFAGADRKTHLIDLNGNEVHQWQNTAQPPVFLDPQLVGGQQGHVLLQLSGGNGGADNKEAQSIGEVDWDGKVVWQWGGAKAQDAYGAAGNSSNTEGYGTDIKQHHDWHRLPNGNTLILINYVKEVKGFASEKLLDDGVYEIDPNGKVVWKWLAYDHLNEFGFSEASLKFLHETLGRGNDKTRPFDYLHFNNMSVVGTNKWFDAGDTLFNPDNILIDSREANFTAIIDKQSGKIVWQIGPDYPAAAFENNKVPRPVDQISGQHDAHIIPKGLPGEGNLLVFDNQGEGGYPPVRLGVGGQLGSRVLEIDPSSKNIVWQYTGANSGRANYTFYSSYISSARRLPNGNTLIDEGMNGRFFQVTAQGEIVWEYISPYFNQPRADDPQKISSNTVYRAQPVPYEWTPAGTPHAEQAITAPDVTQYRVK